MSGIVGSYHNIRGSGVVAKLGTDGQIFTSAGAGLSQGFETAAGGGGKILQVVQTVWNSKFSSTVTQQQTGTTFTAITDATVAITPVHADNKVLITGMIHSGNRYYYTSIKLQKDGSDIAGSLGTNTGVTAQIPVTMQICWSNDADQAGCTPGGLSYLDSPSTTSEVIYSLDGSARQTSTWLINKAYIDTNHAFKSPPISTLTAWEIDGT